MSTIDSKFAYIQARLDGQTAAVQAWMVARSTGQPCDAPAIIAEMNAANLRAALKLVDEIGLKAASAYCRDTNKPFAAWLDAKGGAA